MITNGKVYKTRKIHAAHQLSRSGSAGSADPNMPSESDILRNLWNKNRNLKDGTNESRLD